MSAPVDRSIWDSGDLRTDAYRAFQDSADAVTEAFAAPDAYDRQVEVREFGIFRGRVALSMHFVDVLVHGWDVAATIGAPYHPDPELTAAALTIARQWPDTPSSRGPGAAFSPQVPVSTDAADFERLLGLLGRSPLWTRPF